MNSAPRCNGFRFRQQHRFAEMRSRVGDGQHLREKNALVDFDAVFLALHQCAFGIDLFVRRRQAWDESGGIISEIVDTRKIGRDFS